MVVVVVKTKNRVWLRSKSDPPDPPDLWLTLTRPGPGPELDNNAFAMSRHRQTFFGHNDCNVTSSGPVVFLSKCLAMLPVIWTDDDAESDCKSYFNLYTFVVFLAWIGKWLH